MRIKINSIYPEYLDVPTPDIKEYLCSHTRVNYTLYDEQGGELDGSIELRGPEGIETVFDQIEKTIKKKLEYNFKTKLFGK